MKTMIYLVGFGDRFTRSNYETGWGCGYVMIPTSYSIIKRWQEDCTRADIDADMESDILGIEHYLSKRYFQIGDEEITYTEYKTVNGQEYVVIGFDTAHSYNGPHNDFDWVLNETLKLQQLVEEEEGQA